MYAIINAATNNIPTSYDTSAGSLILNGAPSTGQLDMYNSTLDFIGVTIIGTQTTSVPSSDITVNKNQYLLWPAPVGGASTATKDRFPINQGDKVYIKTLSGSAMALGKVAIVTW